MSSTILPTILVAEDDPDDLYLLKNSLELAGVANPLRSFGNGIEVIEFLKHALAAGSGALPSLLLLDLNLPQIDGAGVIAWIRKNPLFRALRIVVISGTDDSEDVRRATALGADRILIKPATPPVLLEEVGRVNALLAARLPAANPTT